MFNKRLRIVVAVVLALSLMLLASPSAYAATEGDVGGTFQIGNALPTVDTVELYSDDGLGTVASEMTPLTTYYAKVTVSDANYIDNIDEVKLELFYDILGTDALTAPEVANTQTDAIFTWTKGGTFVMSAMAGTTWTIVTAECVEPTMTASSGDWVFAFTVGKVATVSFALTGDWDMYGKATDVALASDERYTYDKDIVFYSEVTAVTTSADFGMVDADTGFLDDVNEVSAIEITYIANGDYSASVMAAHWDGISGGVGAATYDDDPVADMFADEFSLKADIDATYAGAVQVTLAGAIVDATGTITAEAGDATTTNTLWLKLGPTFTEDVYSGTITYIIAPR